MNPAKLKVVELRAELAARGLDTKGNKATLVERLQEALEGEGGSTGPAGEGSATDAGNSTADSIDTETSKDKSLDMPESSQEDIAQDETISEEQEVEDESKDISADNLEEDEDVQSNSGEEVKESTETNGNNEIADNEQPESKSEDQKTEPKSPAKDTVNMEVEIKTDKDTDSSDVEQMDVDKKPEVDNDDAADPSDTSKVEMNETSFNTSIKNEPGEEKTETDEKKVVHSIKTENSSSNDKREDRKRKRSLSPAFQKRSWSPKTMREDEPEIDENAVTLSWYDSDLHLKIDKSSFLSGSPICDAGFGYIWAGVRATYGYNVGKICYQVKLLENCDVSHLEDEPNPNVLRVGWSIFHSSMQLGEESLSYGYGGTGKASVDCKFKDYGSKFTVGDVVTAYLEFTGENAVMSYSVNENHFDAVYEVPEDQLKGMALAPHFLTKNVKFEVNFGQQDPWVPLKDDGFVWANSVPLEQRVVGPRRPQKRTECEIIMMCGLPGSGKTTWAINHCKENPDKHFNIIGTNALIDKMKVMGLPRKGNYSGRWDALIEKCTKCLQRLMDIGCRRRRNFILDQTNVYPAAQRRKMRNFEGFIRKAVVIVPTDEEFKRRIAKRELEEGKDVPDSAVMDMKANFTLPDKGLFNEVVYIELPEPEAKPLVEKYNKEAINAGCIRRGPQGGGVSNSGQSFQGSSISSVKRFRGDYPQQRPRYDNYRRGPPMQPSGGGFRRGNNPPHGGRSGWQQRGPDRGWRDRHHQGSSLGGGGGGGGAGGGGGFRSEGRPSGDRGMSRMGGGSTGGWRGGGSTGGGSGRGRGGMGGDRNMGGDRGMGGDRNMSSDRNSGNDRNTGGGDRSRQGGMDRNRPGGGMDRGQPGNQGRSSNQGGSYERRDNRDSHRPKAKNIPNNTSASGNIGSSGGSISSAGGSGGHHWGQYQQPQHQQVAQQTHHQSGSGTMGGSMGGGAVATNQQHHSQWGGTQQQHWSGQQQQQPQQQQAQQQWNYQWKGYGQGGYNQQQQGYSQQGYNQQQGYGNWQSYGYTGYGQNWPQQTWPNWYGAGQEQQPAVAAHAANTTQPPPK